MKIEEEEKLYEIWLSRMTSLGAKNTLRLLQKYQTGKNIWNLSKSVLEKEALTNKMIEQLENEKIRNTMPYYIKYLKENKIGCIKYQEEQYSDSLKNIYDPPVYLYYKGKIELIKEEGIAIIGCRECTSYGKKIAQQMAYELAMQNIQVISGLARGIDTIAHKNTLKAKGKTIAVLGNGLASMYPKENGSLAQEIIQQGGLILSEYPINSPPEKMHFPARNRIISALAKGVLVIEAREKSGTLITVDFALEQGKSVFAVPGNINSKCSYGTNYLIKQGAKLVTGINDIMEEWNLS